MSLTLSEPSVPKFLDRFEHVRASLLRSQVAVGAWQTVLVAATTLLLLMALDYVFELSWPVRAAGLGLAGVLSLSVFACGVVVPLRWWSRPRTAAEIEERFPELGQRIRTVVQYAARTSDQLDAEGVTPGLVAALEDETDGRTLPLRLDAIVPRRRVAATALFAAIPVLAIALAALSDREWRLALGRSLLGRSMYTTLAVTPGSVRIDQGTGVRIGVVLKGRSRRTVILQTRAAGRPDDPWTTAPMKPKDGGPGVEAEDPRVAEIAKVKDPLVYRVVAGPVASPAYHIGVRYPLSMKMFEVLLRPPAYTAVAPGVVKGGDFQAIEGTAATFRIRFDSAPAEAALVLTNPTARTRPGDPAPEPLRLALEARDGVHTATLTLARSGRYAIEARTAAGRVLPRNRYQIDVQEDRPPRVTFELPDEALEVHPIAEVVHRVRVGDDFGLTRAGIVVRFNDGEEETLIARDFAPGADGKPATLAGLAETLLLEKYQATPTSSVTYYAFAEDNYPSGARRTETDLRYIDIRPFQREYNLAEGAANDNGGESTTLDELIARQRFNLNRSTRLARRQPTDRTPPEDPIRITTFEEALAGMVREFTEGLEGVVGARVEPLHQAEEAMLAAVDALDRGRNDRSPALMAEALRRLIETRQTFRILIGQGGAMARAARRFDRTQAQKIRKPKSKDQEAEELAADLEELAKEEDFVYATLNGLLMDGEPANTGESPSEAPADPPGPSKPEKKDQPAPAPANSSAKGSMAGRGKSGPEGQASPSARGEEDRDDLRHRQETIADRARELEEKLKRLEQASDLAKARMAKAAEAAEKAAGALARGSSREAVAPARAGSLMLHEVARQVKGEVAPEVADELGMARDLAEELARRENEFADGGNDSPAPKPGSPGQGPGPGKASNDAERLAQLEEAARTLEEWLKGAGRNAEGAAADQVRELLQQGAATEIVARAERVSTLYREDRRPESRQEARALAQTLERLARQLDGLHRGIVAPELARLAELDRRLATLTARLKVIRSEGQVAEWKGLAAALARDLEAAGLTAAATELDRVIEADVRWIGGADGILIAPAIYAKALTFVTTRLHERLQELVLKDLTADRDETTPPEFRELVERYYQVLSTGPAGGNK